MIIVILIPFSLLQLTNETNIFIDDHLRATLPISTRDSSRKWPLGLFQLLRWRYLVGWVPFFSFFFFLIHRFHPIVSSQGNAIQTNRSPLSKRSLEIPSPTREIPDCKITLERQWDRFNSQDGGDWSIVFERIVEVAEKTRSKQYIYIYAYNPVRDISFTYSSEKYLIIALNYFSYFSSLL